MTQVFHLQVYILCMVGVLMLHDKPLNPFPLVPQWVTHPIPLMLAGGAVETGQGQMAQRTTLGGV